MDDEYARNAVNHLEAYVEGNIHTNGAESSWPLLKRSPHGTYIADGGANRCELKLNEDEDQAVLVNDFPEGPNLDANGWRDG
jgi:hypothetical protein